MSRGSGHKRGSGMMEFICVTHARKVAAFWAGGWMDIHTRTYGGDICLSWFLFGNLVALVGLELSDPLAPAETKVMCHYVLCF